MTQQFHFWVYIQRKLKHWFKKMYTPLIYKSQAMGVTHIDAHQ